jgi:hypothetical protein
LIGTPSIDNLHWDSIPFYDCCLKHTSRPTMCSSRLALTRAKISLYSNLVINLFMLELGHCHLQSD